MDHDHRLLGVGSSLWDASASERLPVDAETRLREATHDDREQHSLSAPGRPIHRRDEHRALADATVASAPLGRWSNHATNSAYVPVGINHASLSEEAVGVSSCAGAGGAAHDDASPSSPQAGDPPIFGSITGSAIVAGSEAAPLPSFGAGSGATTSPAAESMTVTTDKADYAPGSMATFTVAGINSGSSVTFQITDLASEPGINGIVDVYVPFSVTDGGAGDADGLANGTVVAQWQVPANGSATGALLQVTATSDSQIAITTFSDAPNKISTENQLAGTAKSVWAIHGSIANRGDSQIEGFATQISTNAGQTVSFKIDTASSGYTLDIYRLGYYSGNGARRVATMHHSGADNQPNPIFNTATRSVDAGNWSVTDSWTIPNTAVSGVYFAKLTTDSGNFQNMIPFVVRNDGATSDILFQTSDTTWEAYNPWGGYNLYQGPGGQNDRAYAVSYNRPIDMNSTANLAGPQDFLFGEEYAAIYWLEQNGYNVSYISGIDAATNSGLLRNTKAYIDVGHDEYWSQSQFANVKAAADAGVNLAFLSGNQTYWDIELAPSFDASATPNRTIIEYKDIWSGAQLDPNGTANGGAGLFRDPVYGPGTPENSLAGTIFTVDDIGSLDNMSIPASMSQLRFWRNTSIASGNGGTLTRLLGYEWDSDLDNGFRPAGLIDISSTTRNVNTLLLDNGATTGPGTATHSLTLYRDTKSGALVFGSGTVMWSWGLSNQYAPYRGLTAPVSTAVQQSMVNLFADMGVQPATLQASLVIAQASTDHTVPTTVITSPTGGTTVNQGQTVTITGTASDVGGRVAGIEVSTDGGSTWHPATGTANWSYNWTASGSGTHVIEARATDDSVNLQSSPATLSINVTGTSGPSLFTASNIPAQTNLNDGTPLEIGVKFTSSAAGQITALKFYRSPGDTGSDLLDLWTSTGTKLASATFTNTAASGWQTVPLATPVNINANTTYIASYHTTGTYVATNNFFTAAFSSGTLTAPSTTTAGGNGVYAYGGTSTAGIFPTSTFGAANYWADVVFSSSGGGGNTPPTAVADTGDATEKGGIANGSGGSPASGNVLTNDTDPDAGDTKTVTAVSFGATAGTLGAALTGAHGSLVLNASGAFTYTVNETDAAVQALRLSTNTVTDVFNYTMRDTAGATSTTTLTVSIHGANDAPVLAAQTADQNAVVGSAFSLVLPASTFTDVDSGDTLTYTATAADGSPLPAWLTFNASTRTFSGTPAAGDVGTLSVKASATDLGSLAASETFNIAVTTTPTTVSLFTASNIPAQTNLNDGTPLEVGVKFTSSAAGQITALKFYRSASDTGSDLLDLWTATGTKLASATFTNTAATGWQTVPLATPVNINANTTYIASYHTTGTYVATSNFFTAAVTSGTLTAPSTTTAGGNGVYAYGGTSTAGIFPTSTFGAANYWADVVFRPQLAA
jgi:VCBS repeat-containing protein